MSVFPFMQKIDQKRFLVIGAGKVARRKIRLLLQFTDRITMITHPAADRPSDIPDADLLKTYVQNADDRNADITKADITNACIPGPEMQELSDFARKGVEIMNRRFSAKDLENADYCIASSDSSEDNQRIAALCREAELPVNVPDDPDSCTFFMPSVIRKGNLVITVSTGGSSPAMSAVLRRKIEDILPPNTEEILDLMEELRAWAPTRLPRSQERGRLYAYILGRLMEGTLTPTEKSVHEAAVQWIEEGIDHND